MENKRQPRRIINLSEKKVIKIVAKILGVRKVECQKTFDWLRGDTGMRLRVDAYFPAEKLVFEYHGVQHFKENKLMDRRKGRAEQRKKYTQLRQKLIPAHGLKLLEIRYDEPFTREYIKGRLIQLGYKV